MLPKYHTGCAVISIRIDPCSFIDENSRVISLGITMCPGYSTMCVLLERAVTRHGDRGMCPSLGFYAECETVDAFVCMNMHALFRGKTVFPSLFQWSTTVATGQCVGKVLESSPCLWSLRQRTESTWR